MRIIGSLGITDTLRFNIIKNNMQNVTGSNLKSIFTRMRTKSNFMILCEQMNEEKSKSLVDKQLK